VSRGIEWMRVNAQGIKALLEGLLVDRFEGRHQAKE
jgi:hypothetical protein